MSRITLALASVLCLVTPCLTGCGSSLREAKTHAAAGRHASALAAYREVYAEHRHDPGVNHDIGQIYLRLERFDRAEKFFRRAVTADPKDARSWWFLGLCRARRTMYADGLEAWSTYIALKPADPGGFNNAGLMHLQLGALDRAEAMFDKAIALKPDFGRALLNKGLIYERHRGDDAQAAIWYRRYRQVDPAGATAAGVRDWLLEDQPDSADATDPSESAAPRRVGPTDGAPPTPEPAPPAAPLAPSRTARAAPPDAATVKEPTAPDDRAVGPPPAPTGRPTLSDVEALAREDRPRDIVAWAARHPKPFEVDGQLSLMLGRAHLELDGAESAITHLERARTLRPDDPRPVLDLGRAHQLLGDDVQARAIWRQGRRRWPTDVAFHQNLGVLQ